MLKRQDEWPDKPVKLRSSSGSDTIENACEDESYSSLFKALTHTCLCSFSFGVFTSTKGLGSRGRWVHRSKTRPGSKMQIRAVQVYLRMWEDGQGNKNPTLSCHEVILVPDRQTRLSNCLEHHAHTSMTILASCCPNVETCKVCRRQ